MDTHPPRQAAQTIDYEIELGIRSASRNVPQWYNWPHTAVSIMSCCIITHTCTCMCMCMYMCMYTYIYGKYMHICIAIKLYNNRAKFDHSKCTYLDIHNVRWLCHSLTMDSKGENTSYGQGPARYYKCHASLIILYSFNEGEGKVTCIAWMIISPMLYCTA